MSIEQIADGFGLAGVVIVLIAYGLLHAKIWHAEQIRYSLANALGSVLILFSLCYEWNVSAFVMEVAWLLVSLYGAWQTYRSRTKLRNQAEPA